MVFLAALWDIGGEGAVGQGTFQLFGLVMTEVDVRKIFGIFLTINISKIVQLIVG